MILPLFWVFGFAVHGLTVHLFWTAWQRAYSPGLVTVMAISMAYLLLAMR